VLIINIGARTTNMTFVNAAGFSVQNVNVGGNLLTQAISDALAQPFRTAESLKVAYFSGRTQLADDAHAAVLKKSAQEFMRRISQEVTKRIVIYKRQNQNSQPKKIVLTGRGSLLPGLSELLCETQRISVDYVDPFGVFSVAPSVDAGYLESCRVRLSEITGEAVRGTLPGSVGVNLIPPALESEIAFNRQKPLLIAAAALLALAPWPVWAHFRSASMESSRQIALVEGRSRELSGYKKSIEDSRREAAEVALRVNALHAAAASRDNWREFLADLQSRVSGVKDVWVDEMRFKRTPGASVEGVAANDACSVTVSLNMLLKGVAPSGTFDAADFQARRREILKTLKASPFVADIPAQAEKSDLNKANLPKLTLTLTVKQAHKAL
jgi:type IV pilus assembly protein PilM